MAVGATAPPFRHPVGVEAKKRDGGETPFLVAARASHLACAERLVHKHKADPRAVNVRGEAVLHVAAQHGAPIEVIDRLVDMECDIEAKKEDGATPLIVAARNGHAQVVERLIRHGADARAAMKSGWTALHCAAHHGAPRETVEKLVAAGAEVDAVDRRVPAHHLINTTTPRTRLVGRNLG